jgi:two-component system sensor histidine kinase/response regulator
MQADRDHCIVAGMNDHISKPIEPEDLWYALLKWIKPRHTTDIQQPHQTSQDVELPSGIDGLNMNDGLRRVLGKKSLYLSMLRKFIVGQKFVTTQILNALDSNDWRTAERFTHTLKGVSGNIGAGNLYQMAEKLETAIRERETREKIDSLLERLKKMLENLITQMEWQLPEEIGMVTVDIDLNKLAAICIQLEMLLSNDDAEAVDLLEANAPLLNSAFPHHYFKLHDNIRLFDFESALIALRAATETVIL